MSVIKTGMTTTLVMTDARKTSSNVDNNDDEEEEDEEETKRLDKLEAELLVAQANLATPTYNYPPIPPIGLPKIDGDYENCWGVTRPCSVEMSEIINGWLRLHQAQGWRRHDAISKREIDIEGKIHVIQQAILYPPQDQGTNPLFPTIRSIYFCFATL